MAQFNDMIITKGGKFIYAKAMAGKPIAFTKVLFGSGNPVSQTEAEALTGLVRSEIAGAVESINTTSKEGVAIITAAVNNETLNNKLSIKEIGVFCNDPDTGEEVMYAYCYSPNDIDVIPSSAGGVVVWKIRIQLEITNVVAQETPIEQTDFIDFTPVITQTATDETVYISQVIATGRYTVKHDYVTVYYSVTGKLTNMEAALNELTSLAISLPLASRSGIGVHAPMHVVIDDGTTVLVDVLGEIAPNKEVIDLNYIGTQNGDFRLNFSVQYYL